MADLDGRKREDLEPEELHEDHEEKPEPNEQETIFVRERILNRTESRRKWIARAAGLLGGAVLFGVISCLVFVWLRPHAERWFNGEEPETAIQIPEEETTGEEELSSSEASSSETEEDIEEVVESAVQSHKWSVSDYENIYEAMSELADSINQGIVTVTTWTQRTDWFDNAIETEGRASGVIWNITSSEILILTSYQVSANETTVEVTFNNGVRTAAVVKAADGKTGIAIVSVSVSDVDTSTLSSIVTVPLGSSLSAAAGQPVILVGNPKDYVGSIAYGMISYVRASVQREDMTALVMYTDVATTSGSSGFVVNLDGQIIGMITADGTGTNTSAIGISDLKTTIERLSNGMTMAYFGVTGQDVTTEISQNYQLPVGIYVTEAVMEGPAYNSGLQNGDVITSMDGQEILTVKTMQSFLEGKQPGDMITVQVQRAGRDGYTPVELLVTLGTR